MSQLPGFRPIPFRRVGKLLIAIGAAGLLLLGVSKLFLWLTMPEETLIMSLFLIAIGLYLIFVVPREDTN